MNIATFWDCASPLTLAGLVIDIDRLDDDVDFSEELRTRCINQLVSIVGLEESIRLVAEADEQR
jgi:hypothetical protein